MPEDVFRRILDALPICPVDVAFVNPEVAQTLVFRRVMPPLVGEWFTIGGRLRKNERLLERALWQAREEAGLTLDPERLFFGGGFEEIHDASCFDGIAYHAVNFCWGYLLSETPAIVLDRQHDGHAWRSTSGPEFGSMLSRELAAVAALARELSPGPAGY